MTRRGASSLVLSLAFLLGGCAGLIPGRERPEPEALPRARGGFEVQKGRPGFVIAAPHGTSDSATDLIGRDLARLTGWGLVLVTGFSHLDADGRRYNVNRPTESVPGVPPRGETESAAAREVYQAFRRHVAEAAQGRLQLYVEVHGNGRKDSAARVEIATIGLTRDDAWRMKTLLELIRDARLEGVEGVPRLEVLVEPLDALWYTASAAKQSGLLGTMERALHIELPRAARTTHRDTYTQVLAEFLAQAGPLLAAGR